MNKINITKDQAINIRYFIALAILHLREIKRDKNKSMELRNSCNKDLLHAEQLRDYLAVELGIIKNE